MTAVSRAGALGLVVLATLAARLRGHDRGAAFRLSGPEQAPQDPGRDWPAEHGILKQVSVSEGLGGFVPPKALARGAALLTCPADLRVNELRSGVTVIANAIWPTTHVNGLPAAPGPYVVSASFPFLARMAAGPFPVPRTRWYGGEVEYGIGVWVFTLRVGMPDERAIVTVDATSGAVRDFRVAIGP